MLTPEEEIKVKSLEIIKLKEKLAKLREEKQLAGIRRSKKKERLLKEIQALAKVTKSSSHKTETEEHLKAEDLLLDFINDEEINIEFNKRWIFYP